MPQLSVSEWDHFISQFSNVHLLQTSAWGDLKADFGWQISRIASSNAGAQILFKTLPFGVSWAYIPKGPLGVNWHELWPQVDAECRRRRAVFLKVEPDLWDRAADSSSGWLPSKKFHLSPHHIQPPRSILVDISDSDDEILSRMKQKTRYNIRLASRKGVRFFSSVDVDSFHSLMLITGERDAFGVHSLEYYQRAFDLFAPEHCQLFFAEFGGKLLAALMVFASGPTAWYFYGASSDEHRNLMAPYAVQWAAIQWAKSLGCVTYDLWGVPDADHDILESNFTKRQDGLWGVYRFKRGFGGELIRGKGAWDRVYNPIFYFFYRLWMKKNLV